MCLLAAANGFVTLFVALELFSVSLYVLCALDVHDSASLESGLKYLVTGSVGSAALLFGSGLAYIATGSLRFDEIGKALARARRTPPPAARHRDDHRRVGLQGLGGAVPHVDAGRLRGRAHRGHGFMATATKTIALATLLRVWSRPSRPPSDVWRARWPRSPSPRC